MSLDAHWLVTPLPEAVQLWRLAPTTAVLQASLKLNHANPVAVSSNGLWTAAFDSNGVAFLSREFKEKSWSPVTENRPSHLVQIAVFSPDSKFAFVADQAGHCFVRDRTTWRLLFQWTAPDTVQAGSFSPQGDCIAIACKNGLAFVWDWRKQRIRTTLIGHTDSINGIAFSPDADFIVTAGADRTARLWSTQTGFCFATLRGHISPLLAASFGPGAQTVLTASEDGMVRVYSFPECCPDKGLLRLAHSADRAVRLLTPVERQVYLHTP
jgi:WD40 repeat protein